MPCRQLFALSGKSTIRIINSERPFLPVYPGRKGTLLINSKVYVK